MSLPSDFTSRLTNMINDSRINDQKIPDKSTAMQVNKNIGELSKFISDNESKLDQKQLSRLKLEIFTRLEVINKAISTSDFLLRPILNAQIEKLQELIKIIQLAHKVPPPPVPLRPSSQQPIPREEKEGDKNPPKSPPLRSSPPPLPMNVNSPLPSLHRGPPPVPPGYLKVNVSQIQVSPPKAEQVFEEFSKALELKKNTSSITSNKWGEILLKGMLGVPQNPAGAVKIFSELAEKGDPIAKYHLGNCYEIGLGIGADLKKAEKLWEEAVKIFKKSANKEGESAYYLGLCFFEGKGVKKNLNDAEEYWKMAAAKSYGKAFYSLGTHCPFREEYKKHLSISDNEGMIEKAAAMGVVEAKQWIGFRNLLKLVVNPQAKPEVAFNNFKEAALLGDTYSLLQVAKCYLDGMGVAKDPEVAKKILDEVGKILTIPTSAEYREMMNLRGKLEIKS